jgi:N-acyl-D-aspartate/D-glutamate deacylase
MPYDLIIRDGMVVDGSGFSRYRADVAVMDGRIAEIGRIRGSARRTIDAEGRFVTPGIIDLHTHYDVQPFWDRLCTSSIWHGVTTVLTGNCGLTLAPLRPEHRETMLATFCCVEDLPVSSLAAVLPWTWQSFDEFLKAIDIGLGVNMMPLVGHNPLRLSVMDGAAWDRAATPDEMAAMQALLRAALEEGAWGWSTTNSPTHAGPQGQPVPTRLATDEERIALGRTLGEFNRGVIEILPPGAGRPTEADQQHLLDVAQAAAGPSSSWASTPPRGATWKRRRGRGRSSTICSGSFPSTRASRSSGRPTSPISTCGTSPWRCRSTSAWRISPIPASAQSCARRPRSGSAAGPACSGGSSSGTRSPSARSRSPEPRPRGTLDRRSRETSGKHVADAILDLAVEERLETEFLLQSRPPAVDVELADYVKTGHAIPSQTDAGAHLNTNFCTAGESSYVLGEWVRERQLLTLEDAIRRYTFQPARIMGLNDRGLVREGMVADLVVFDLDRINITEDEITRDGPSGSPRRVQRAEGVEHVIVGGEPVLDHGQHTGALPGRVLRAPRRA